MRFLDSSVFLHAFLKPKRKLSNKEKLIKNKAKKIISRVDNGEEVATTVIHLSEILNIIESRLGLVKSIQFLLRVLSLSNIKILDVAKEDYEAALLIAQRYSISPNDALAYIKMKQHGIKEIYTFDKHFKNIPDIAIIQN